MGNKQDFEIRKSIIRLSSGQPMQFVETGEDTAPRLSDAQDKLMWAVGRTVRHYLEAAHELLEGKYTNIKNIAPLHLRNDGMVLVVCCEDGVIIRHDIKEGEKQIMVSWWPGSLSQIALQISDSVIYCHSNRNFTSAVPQTAPQISVFKTDNRTGERTNFFSARIGFHVVLESPSGPLPIPQNKPYRLLSVQNSLEIHLLGEMLPGEFGEPKGKPFLLRTKLRLPVGWECIEIFPFVNVDQWKPEYTKLWAENDILASVMAAQFAETSLHTLDPYASARKEIANLLKKYKDLLDSKPEREEILQSFLKEYPTMICPIYTMVKPKLQIGGKVTDFVFREATGDYLLVELEKSIEPLFSKSGDTSRQLNHARNQVSDWRRYIEDNLSTVQRELDLPNISSSPKGLIIIGRSESLNEENRRKLITLENEAPKTKIMTYDDIFVNAKAVVENLLGPLWLEAGNTEIYYLPENPQLT